MLHARDDALVPLSEERPAFLSELREFTGVSTPTPEPLEELSAREREVMRLVAEGLSNEEIAERMVLSVRTVERHLSNI